MKITTYQAAIIAQDFHLCRVVVIGQLCNAPLQVLPVARHRNHRDLAARTPVLAELEAAGSALSMQHVAAWKHHRRLVLEIFLADHALGSQALWEALKKIVELIKIK